MNPKPKIAGIAGILTGLALLGEFAFFMISGYNPQTFTDPTAALAFLRESGGYVQIAVLFGAAGVAFRTLYVAGLAARLQAETPTRATATLYFGLLGGLGHGLVALSLFVGIPMFVALALRDSGIASNAWGAFTIITSGYQSLGNFLIGLALVSAGWAIIAQRALPAGVGWVGLLAGLTTIVGVFSTGTPLAAVAFILFFPSILLATVFDIWAGIALLKSAG
jgi:hypothetical protein